jgi:hypothetical protein
VTRKRATESQVAAVRRLVREQVATVEKLEPQAMVPTLRVLAAARREMQHELAHWVGTVKDPTERFGPHQLRVLLRQLEGTIEALGANFERFVANRPTKATAAERALLDTLKKGTHSTGHLAVKNLEAEITKLGHMFGESIVAPNISAASVVSRGERLLLKRSESSAARYATNIAADLRFQLGVGVARNETFEQLTQRLRRLGGPRGPVAVRGIFGTPSAIIEDIPEGLFVRYRHFAERIVRTELMHEYNIQHIEGIRELNAMSPKGGAPALKIPKLSRKTEGVVETVSSRSLTDYGFYRFTNMSPGKLENARKHIREGQRDPITAVVSPNGQIYIDDGRHRLQAAIEAGVKVKVKYVRGSNVDNSLDPGVEHVKTEPEPHGDVYQMRWDSAADRRVCPDCKHLDGCIAPMGGTFLGWGPPPLHPNCRCIVLAWRADWPEIWGDPSDRVAA